MDPIKTNDDLIVALAEALHAARIKRDRAWQRELTATLLQLIGDISRTVDPAGKTAPTTTRVNGHLDHQRINQLLHRRDLTQQSVRTEHNDDG